MTLETAQSAIWEAINTLDSRIENAYDVIRVKNARNGMNYLENWIFPSPVEEKPKKVDPRDANPMEAIAYQNFLISSDINQLNKLIDEQVKKEKEQKKKGGQDV